MSPTGMPLRAQVIMLALLAGIIYSNTLDNGFVWDDVYLISRNVNVHHLRYVPRHFTSPFFGDTNDPTAVNRGSYWRPLTMLSFNLDYALWRNNPTGYHLTNLLLHSFNAVMVLLLFRAIPRTRHAAFPAALIFTCHPLQTNIVAYISGRTYLLAALFLLLGCFILARRLAWPGDARGVGCIVTACAVGACGVLAMLSVEVALAAPLLILIAGALAGRLLARPMVHSVLASAVALCGALYCRHRIGIPSPAVNSLSLRTVLAAADSLMVYIRLLLLPVGLHMERFIPVPALSDPGALMAAGLLILLALMTVRAFLRRDGAPGPLLWCWAFTAFFPASNVIPIYPEIANRQIFIGEHFLYVPLIGISGAIACAWESLRARWGGALRPPYEGGENRGALTPCEAGGFRADLRPSCGIGRTLSMAGGIAVLALFSALTYAHNEYWRDEDTFYSMTLAKSPESVRMNTNLGILKVSEGDYEESLRLLHAVAAQNPRSAAAHINLGQTYRAMERFADARKEFLAAQRISPGSPDVLNALGALSMAEGKHGDAVAYFGKAIAASPLSPGARVSLATAYLSQNKAVDAERVLRGALGVDPGSFEARMLLGMCYEKLRRLKEACEIYRAIAKEYPDYSPAVEKADRLSRKRNEL
ncbi:MAG: tetratricopeptide repeat protein [Chlamydiota bacterium]